VTIQINTKFAEDEVALIECLVQKKKATSRSDVIRYAVRRYLETVKCEMEVQQA
jgi:Arc/MetJ-type ribon-helix-helix transcriptional regulator